MYKQLTKKILMDAHNKFREKEGRYSFFDMSKKLMENGFKTEGRLLLLAGWNGAWFSKISRNFKITEFETLMKRCEPLFKKLKNKTLTDSEISEIEDDTKAIYKILSSNNAVKYTGATKLMSLEIPSLFVMWDDAIRNDNRYAINGISPDNYVEFLKIIKKNIDGIIWDEKSIPLAKVIDEYNYVTITLKPANKKNKNIGG